MFKNYKQMPISQTSTNINLPKGTNPKRSFGRDLGTGSQSSAGASGGIQKKKLSSHGYGNKF